MSSISRQRRTKAAQTAAELSPRATETTFQGPLESLERRERTSVTSSASARVMYRNAEESCHRQIPKGPLPCTSAWGASVWIFSTHGACHRATTGRRKARQVFRTKRNTPCRQMSATQHNTNNTTHTHTEHLRRQLHDPRNEYARTTHPSDSANNGKKIPCGRAPGISLTLTPEASPRKSPTSIARTPCRDYPSSSRAFRPASTIVRIDGALRKRAF